MTSLAILGASGNLGRHVASQAFDRGWDLSVVARSPGRLPAPQLLPLLGWTIPEMIIPYADAAGIMLDDIAADSPRARRRVGVALPAGMRGSKDRWVARPPGAG